MMDIPSIASEADYEAALREIEQYFAREPEPATEGADRFDALAKLIERYEAIHWPIEAGPN